MLTRLFVLLLLALITSTSFSQAPKRFALVIGNDSYRTVEPLKNARNDARAFAQAMRDAKFEVIAQDDLSREQFWGVIDKVKGRMSKGDELVFYFAGHGVQIGANQYLLPVDIPVPDSERQVERSAIPLVEVLESFSDARVSVFVIDACRDNPFPKKSTRSLGDSRGLSRPEPTTGQIVILSAGRNQRALDSVPGRGSQNGLFTYELIQVIRNGNPEVRSAFETVKERVDDVARKANHQQRPAVSHDLRGNFFFYPEPKLGLVASIARSPGQRVETRLPTDEEIEAQEWNDAQRGNTLAAYQAFISAYPGSRYAGRAQIALAALSPSRSNPSNGEINQPPQFNRQTSTALSSDLTGETIRKVASTGTITVGVRESSGALSYALGNGKYAGFHIDVCSRVIANLEKVIGRKLDVKFQSVTSQSRISSVQDGTVDLECGSTANNANRQLEVSFLPTTFVEELRIAVKANSGITTVAQLSGKNVAITSGTTSNQLLRRSERATGVDFKEVFGKDHSDSFMLLESGRADAFVMDGAILAGNIAVSQNPAEFRIIGEVLSVEPIAIMIRKDDTAFKKIGADTIAEMVGSGEMAKLWDKWFMQPIPPRNTRLGYTLNQSTRAAWSNLNDRPMEDYAVRK